MRAKKEVVAKLPTISPDEIPVMKKFILKRFEDASGTSGTGIVACGLLFSSGHCVLEWATVVRSIGIYNSIADVEAIHGHGGMTRVEWLD